MTFSNDAGQVGRHDARQADETAHRGDQADLHLGERDLGLLLGHDQVAGERELEAATEGVSVEGGDDRLVDPPA